VQTTGLLPTQLPAWQVSVCVQALASLQGAVLLVKTHPAAGTQASVVHTLLSLHTSAAPPRQVPAEQVSLVVHGLPSLQGAVLLVCMQAPVAGLQESSVQSLPSLQGPVLLVCTQAPVVGLQESSVQTLSSLQLTAAPTQIPPEHASPVVQRLPSLQGAVLLVKTQPVAGAQVSSVHGLLSLQTSAAPA